MLLPASTLPLTGVRFVKKVITDLAIVEISEDGFVLKERAPGVSIEEIQAKTAGKLIIEGDVKDMGQGESESDIP